ncbi:MAG TPA: HAD family hydrolase [Jatrophihabitans sp.]|nr:HAD family hydrolase [Jatrophihabitans sp.]
MIKLVATDLDGTLLRSDGTVSERSRAALAAAAAAALPVVFVTGRPPRWLDVLAMPTGYRGIAVGANGAVLYDMTTERIVSAYLLDPPLLMEIGAELRAAFPDVAFAVEYSGGFAAEPDYVHDWEINPPYDRRGVPIAEPRIGSLAEIIAEPAVKLLAKDHRADPDAFADAAAAIVGERATVTHSSAYGLLEVSVHGITKATGLAEVARQRGIAASEVLAIGDMPNDVPMLRWAGRAYAVANAHPEVLGVADEVIGSNDDDAVAILIEQLLASPFPSPR